MKQVIKLDVITSSSTYSLSFKDVYKSNDKLIALAKIDCHGEGVSATVMTTHTASVEVDVPEEKELPVDIYLVGGGHCGKYTDNFKQIDQEDVSKLIEGLTPLKISPVASLESKEAPKESNSWRDKAQQFISSHPSLKDRNTLFAVAAVAGTVAVAGAYKLLRRR